SRALEAATARAPASGASPRTMTRMVIVAAARRRPPRPRAKRRTIGWTKSAIPAARGGDGQSGPRTAIPPAPRSRAGSHDGAAGLTAAPFVSDTCSMHRKTGSERAMQWMVQVRLRMPADVACVVNASYAKATLLKRGRTMDTHTLSTYAEPVALRDGGSL